MRQFGKNLVSLFKREDGAAAVEYSLIVVLIALAIAIGAALLGTNLGAFFSALGNFFTGAVNAIPNVPIGGS
jgi:Flp pilus assembly pilin Flp